MCTVTSRRVGCGCTVWSFTTHGECGLSLSLGLRPMKKARSVSRRVMLPEMTTHERGYHVDLELSDRSRG